MDQMSEELRHFDHQVMPKLINLLSSLLERAVQANDLNRDLIKTKKISIFDGLTRPSISLKGYLERIFKYAHCSPSCFVVAYVYLDRFVQKQPSLPINSFNVHRLLITSVLVSVKFMDDIFYNNAYYAKVGGVSITEMNLLETDFLFGLGFQLNVSPNMFQSYCAYLQTEMLLDSPPLQSSPISLLNRSERPQSIISFNNDEESSHHHQQQELIV